MNYEKAYQEALERAKNLRKDAIDMDESIRAKQCEIIFPELAESKDEKIRKWLICGMNALKEQKTETFATIPIDDAISWLEKQGDISKLSEEEQKPVVNFKAEDWYVSKVDGKIYNAKYMEKTPTNQTRKLEIEKAAMSATGIIEQEEWFIKGAEWSDKNPSYISSEKQGEKKTIEWNERDERVLTEIINDVKFTQSKNPNSYMNQLLFKKEIDWLKSLKQRIGG